MEAARKDEKRAELVKDKLILDGVLYNPLLHALTREENNVSGNTLKIIFWNINGGFLSKFQEKSLISFLLTYEILLTECWLQNEAELSVSGYVVRLFPRNKVICIQGGGIAVLIRKDICHFVSICEIYEDTVLWLKI